MSDVEIPELQRFRAEPGDVLVLHSKVRLTEADAERLKSRLTEAMGNVPVVLIDKDLDLSVMNLEALETR